ncbi:MAG: histidine phosphatase family protein [Mycoplasmataceae bacterium]|nr:histidine phosphatase family protein [Mycoplasmataceae bacterium]
MTKIYYVRHGQTDYNVKNIWAGSSNAKLTKEGKKQAQKTGEELKDVKFDVAFVSPLKRARKTFKYINKFHHLKPNVDERIKERNFGKLEGTPAGETSPVSKQNMYNYDLNDDFGLGVEKIQDTNARVVNFIEYVLKNYEGKEVLVVAHGAIGRHFDAYFNGLPENHIMLKGPKNAECIIYKK